MAKLFYKTLSVLACSILVSGMPLYAAVAADDIPDAFIVWTASGGKVSFPLKEHPTLTFNDTEIILTTTKTSVEYDKTDVVKFTLGNNTGTSVSSMLHDDTRIMRKDDVILLEHFSPFAPIRIYSISGYVVYNGKMSAEGSMSLSVSDYPSGTYILRAEKSTYKIIKK